MSTVDVDLGHLAHAVLLRTAQQPRLAVRLGQCDIWAETVAATGINPHRDADPTVAWRPGRARVSS